MKKVYVIFDYDFDKKKYNSIAVTKTIYKALLICCEDDMAIRYYKLVPMR